MYIKRNQDFKKGNQLKSLILIGAVICSVFSYGGLKNQGNSSAGQKANQCKQAFTKQVELLNLDIFHRNDIRGVFLKDFDLNFSTILGKALVTLSQNKFSVMQPKILIGYDARESGPELTKFLAESLVNNGALVSVVGLVPTPLAYSLLHQHDYTAAVIITASHNPVEYNGFKVMFHKKHTLKSIISDLKGIIESDAFLREKDFISPKGKMVSLDPFASYIKSLKKEFPNLKSLPFVLDTGNGSAGPFAKKVFTALGLKPHYLFIEPDGTFPNHHPDPTKEKNIIDLKEKVAETDSLFGIGFDGDGDRIIVVTREGKTIQPDEFAYMFLPTLLNTKGVSKNLIADVKVSDWYYKKAKEMGGDVFMSQTGYSIIRESMEKNNASLAVELSGHIMFNDRPGRGFDDALYNAIRFIELVGNNKGDIKGLLPRVKTVSTNEIRLYMEWDKIYKSIDNIKDYFNKKNESYEDIDGVRVSRDNSWALVRHSQTEKLLSLRFEADTKINLLNLMEELSEAMDITISEESVVFSD